VPPADTKGEGAMRETYLKQIRIKARYSHPLRLFFDAVAKLGLRITPYYVVLEGLFGGTLPAFEKPLDGFAHGYFEAPDMPAVARIPGRRLPLEALIERLDRGQRCYGVKYEGRPVAFNWFDFEKFRFDQYEFRLQPNEACLYDAFTDMDFRGRGLVPYIRYQSYKELERLGRGRIYSGSDYFNTSSLRFKQKLNAKLIELHLVVILFKRWRRRFVLKTYPE
jgi:hypothetical protein